MLQKRASRRLAAILAADVVGYSRMMGANEYGTLKAVKRLRTSTMEQLLKRFEGRLIKTTGDGFLFEFGNVFDAFDFAAAIQRRTPDEEALQLRMGLNVGDIIFEDGDVFGDGVNIAARLELLSPPGGLMVSNRAWEDLSRLPLTFEDAGDIELKNIKERLRAWRLQNAQLREYSDALRQAKHWPTLRGVAQRLFTYCGLAFALIFLGMQIAPPRIPAASAATPVADVTRILPPLPELPPTIGEPIDNAALFEITLPYPAGGDLPGLLVTAGASEHEAKRAAALVAEAFSGMVDARSELKLALGVGKSGQDRPIEQLTLLSDLGRGVIVRDGGSLKVNREAASTRHVKVDIASGPYGSLRDAGLDARLAFEVAALVEKKGGDFRSVTAVTGERPDRFGTNATPQLLFLALERTGRRPLRLLKWPGTADGWIDADRFGPESAFSQPVSGRVSSTFGIRAHPILRFFRPHQGVDFAASWGTPVRAAADGRVAAAEWRGGYGRQVQVNHAEGLATSYSHLSDMVAKPGSWVRRGQIVGYVGASGLATGPHLHFEIMRSGRRIDPLTARLVDAGNAADRAAVAARLAQLKIAGT